MSTFSMKVDIEYILENIIQSTFLCNYLPFAQQRVQGDSFIMRGCKHGHKRCNNWTINSTSGRSNKSLGCSLSSRAIGYIHLRGLSGRACILLVFLVLILPKLNTDKTKIACFSNSQGTKIKSWAKTRLD